ncbi:hypothetical protein QQS21_008777 [Conoideocrella luteorostrata]|uniref:Uncharacterized protein n=1 Tax=Conoideocrella luteorostrata TaxID=1105319 RepID=A0AAJ0CML7_9HYPO|nr:hypothetical protein QQS21_008777 [Conoideocrella luteorostrata]
MSFKVELDKVGQLYQRLTSTSCPELTSAQVSALKKITDVVAEGHIEWEKHGVATRRRRRRARTLILNINQRLGVEVLLLCSIAFSMTKLSRIKDDADFISKLQGWKERTGIAESICNLAKQQFAPHNAMLSQPATSELIMGHGKTTKQPNLEVRTEPTAPGHRVIPNYHGIQHLAPAAQTHTDGKELAVGLNKRYAANAQTSAAHETIRNCEIPEFLYIAWLSNPAQFRYMQTSTDWKRSM